MKKEYPEESDPHYRYLKELQSNRLKDTYADYSEQDHYRAATFFFFERLYSTKDTTDRDESFRSIYGTVKRFLGGEVAHSMSLLIELQEITIEMDLEILDLLADLTPDYSMETYERAYRDSHNYDLRVRQIELLDITIRMVHRISHRFGIGLVLASLKSACILLGDTRMVDFLMDGYKAFAHIKDIEPLAQAITKRETDRLDRIYEISAPTISGS